MKKHFHHHDITFLLDDTKKPSVHCTRCGREYPMTDMVFGYRDGEHVVPSWHCKHDDCYGSYPQDIYPLTASSE